MRYLVPSLLISASLILVGCDNSSPAESSGAGTKIKKARIELASFFPASLNILGEQITHLADEMESVSGGSIEMEIYDPGALVGPMEILDAVSDGKVDAGYTTAGFWIGKLPASPLFSAIPFGPNSSEFIAWLYQGNGMDLYQEMYDNSGFNVKVLICSMIPPETSGWFANEINSAEDLKGLKMRFFGLGGLVMDRLGVSVSLLPSGEIFPSLEKGVIDATEFALPSVDAAQGFYKIAKYNYFPGWHQQSTAFEMIFNKDYWNSLSEMQRAQIETVCRAGVTHSIAYSESLQASAIKYNEEHHGVHIRQWSAEMLALFESTWEEVADEQAAKNPFFKKVWDDLQAFRSEYASWGQRAYLR